MAEATQLIERYGVVTREMVSSEGIEGGFSRLYPVFKAMEEAGRIRDEIKRLQATELAIADDPFARQQAVDDAAAEAAARKRPRFDDDGVALSPAPTRPNSRGGRPGSKPSRGRRR